jgi:hypothetical protein
MTVWSQGRKKRMPGIVVLLARACALPVHGQSPSAQPQPDVPADGIQMARTKQAVTFNHSTHQKGMQCIDCHHPVNDRLQFGKCADAGCHDSMDRKDKSAKGYYRVLHAKSGTQFATCASCHAQASEKFPDRKKELTACKQSRCHP